MVKHVVLWRLKSAHADSRQQAFDTIRAALEAQAGRVPGLLRMEAGLNFGTSRRAVDFVLYSEFESREALEAYHRHPAHLETRSIVDPLVGEHWIVDYEA
jgi:quinol monooxygenase YgiN